MENIRKKILEAYGHYVQDRGQEPAIAQLIAQANCAEDDFYREFNSISSVRNGLWQHFADQTFDRIQAEDVYLSYTAREKSLSFLYTLIEELKPFRHYAIYAHEHHSAFISGPTFLKGFKHSYKAFALEVLAEGMESGEIASRPFISDQYEHVLWKLVEFTIHFWLKDDSEAFEQTDSAIEKSVNLAFDFMAHGVFDSAFDFGKFLFQSFTQK